ncbi:MULTISPECIES: hypothetical protein [unclassified Moorena]|uniref:hypothetical protein n=1 Tax=unclassified Moorena TaxID=2683338 RepID=UPI001401B4D8|nr:MULTISPECIES: hypothetical protein [unclassified Moorena]NEO15772.1 hypothetical protein [Moorena sp. SIO3E8]NEQ02219.1 hypothetical protein [Moorena sp. SIO3F7]
MRYAHATRTAYVLCPRYTKSYPQHFIGGLYSKKTAYDYNKHVMLITVNHFSSQLFYDS